MEDDSDVCNDESDTYDESESRDASDFEQMQVIKMLYRYQ